MAQDEVNILHCCGGHEEHLDSCYKLWTDEDWDESELWA